MGTVRWCEHHFVNPNGVHMCRLKINILSLLPFGRHGMRFTMPCNTDKATEFNKVSCSHFKLKPNYEDVIRERARLERERRVRRNAEKAERRRVEPESDGSFGCEGEGDELLE